MSFYVDAEHSIGHLLDVGIILPRLSGLYDWSARELEVPGLRTLLLDEGPTPAYAWDPRTRRSGTLIRPVSPARHSGHSRLLGPDPGLHSTR